MLWSIVVPVNKFQPKLLDRCLRSVLMCCAAPSKPDMQLMVVDSSGDPAVKEYLKTIGYFNWYAIEDKGMAANWNQAIKLSDGDWVHLLHDDDYVLNGFYAAIDRATQTDAGAASVGYECENEAGVVTFSNTVANDEGIFEGFTERILLGNCLMPSAVVIKRSTYDRLGFYVERIEACVDWEMYCRIAIAGIPWWSTPQCWSRRLEHSQSATCTGGDLTLYRGLKRAIEIIEKYIPGDLRIYLNRARRDYGDLALQRSMVLRGEQASGLYKTAQELLKPLLRA